MTLSDFGYPVYTFGFIAPKALNYLAFQSFDFDRTWWKLFQKRVVRTKFDNYVFIIQTYIQSLETVKELHHIFNLLELPRNF